MNFLTTFRRAALTLAALALGTVAHAETLTLTDDAATANKAPTVNAGTAETLIVSSRKGGKKTGRAFLRFKLTDLPAGLAGTGVAKATLRLYVDSVTVGGTVQVYPLTSDFAEDTVTDGTAPTLGATPVGSFTVDGTNLDGFVSVDVTPAVRAAVQAGASSLGVALLANGDLNVAFDSKENVATSHPAGIDVIVTSFGPQGPQGVAGPVGAQGPQGVAGLQGATGAPGPQGAQGFQGLQGATGLQGSPGVQGVPGIQGVPGNPGPLGPQGPQGTPGDLRIFGNGNEGAVTISSTANFSDADGEFTNFTVNAGVFLIVPSGTIIRCTGTFVNNGTIIVGRGTVGGQVGLSATDAPQLPGAGLSAQPAVNGGFTTSGAFIDTTNAGVGSHPGATGLRFGGPLAGGAGGGPGAPSVGGGGSGGGTFAILAGGTITNAGTINVGGFTGGNGGGGGAGGFVYLLSATGISNNVAAAVISVAGGSGGASVSNNTAGGGGAGGVVRLLAPAITLTAGTINTTGGAAGSTAMATTATTRGGGGSGGAWVNDGGVGAGGDSSHPPSTGNVGALFSTVTTLPTAFF